MISRTAALAMLVAVTVPIAGCGFDGPTVGVAAVAAEPSAGPEPAAEALTPLAAPDRGADTDGDVAVASGPTGADAGRSPSDTLIAPPAPLPRTVAVVGDSLTVSAHEEIETALSARGLTVLAIDGLESRRMAHGGSALPPGVDAVDGILADAEPGLWVIALGTNDVASDESLSGFRADLQAVLAPIPDDAPIIWVDLWISGREGPIAEANQIIRSELRRRSGGAAVVDWFGHGTDDGVITGDGVHLTDLGQELYAAAIVDAIDGLYPG